MIREIKVWNVRCTAETLRLLIVSGRMKLGRDEYEVQCGKAGRAMHCLLFKNDLQAMPPSARQS